jgi:hypothetical protein
MLFQEEQKQSPIFQEHSFLYQPMPYEKRSKVERRGNFSYRIY